MNESLTTRAPLANTDDDGHLIELWLRKQRNKLTRESYGRTAADGKGMNLPTPFASDNGYYVN